MKSLAFSVRDQKSGIFSRPFFAVSKGIALRDFSDLAVDDKSSISKHPEDYSLHFVGEFDDLSGAFVPVAQPEFLAVASDFITDISKKG